MLAAEEESSTSEELEERIRTIVEQCDCVQGVLSGCDWDWMWAGVEMLHLVGDACPKLQVTLQTFNPLKTVIKAEVMGNYIVELADFSHLLHIPAIWDDYTEGLQSFAPALFAENMSLPCRIANSSQDLRLFLQPLLPSPSSNLATAVINSPTAQMTLGLPPTQCSLAQRWTRGLRSDLNYTIPKFQTSKPFPIEAEYETICARTSAFGGWITSLADTVLRTQRDDDGRETVNRLQVIAESYT